VGPIFSEERHGYRLGKPPPCQYFISPLPLNYYKQYNPIFAKSLKWRLRTLVGRLFPVMNQKMKGNMGNLYQLFLFCKALDMLDVLEKFMVAKSLEVYIAAWWISKT